MTRSGVNDVMRFEIYSLAQQIAIIWVLESSISHVGIS